MATENTNRAPKRVITGHNAEGKGVIHHVDEGVWAKIDNDIVRYNAMWTTNTFPIDINNDDNLVKEKTVLSLSLPNGTVLRMVDRSPGSSSAMHRTQSLDYGVVIEGEMEMLMDSGRRSPCNAVTCAFNVEPCTSGETTPRLGTGCFSC